MRTDTVTVGMTVGVKTGARIAGAIVNGGEMNAESMNGANTSGANETTATTARVIISRKLECISPGEPANNRQRI
jgi:hypothetical protein